MFHPSLSSSCSRLSAYNIRDHRGNPSSDARCVSRRNVCGTDDSHSNCFAVNYSPLASWSSFIVRWWAQTQRIFMENKLFDFLNLWEMHDVRTAYTSGTQPKHLHTFIWKCIVSYNISFDWNKSKTLRETISRWMCVCVSRLNLPWRQQRQFVIKREQITALMYAVVVVRSSVGNQARPNQSSSVCVCIVCCCSSYAQLMKGTSQIQCERVLRKTLCCCCCWCCGELNMRATDWDTATDDVFWISPSCVYFFFISSYFRVQGVGYGRTHAQTQYHISCAPFSQRRTYSFPWLQLPCHISSRWGTDTHTHRRSLRCMNVPETVASACFVSTKIASYYDQLNRDRRKWEEEERAAKQKINRNYSMPSILYRMCRADINFCNRRWWDELNWTRVVLHFVAAAASNSFEWMLSSLLRSLWTVRFYFCVDCRVEGNDEDNLRRY